MRWGGCQDDSFSLSPVLVVSGRLPSVPDPWPAPPSLDQGVHDALCDLHAYVLVLDAEWRRVTQHVAAIEESDADDGRRQTLVRRERELSQELDSLRAMIADLRREVDPYGFYL
jgi:hypothetical protein